LLGKMLVKSQLGRAIQYCSSVGLAQRQSNSALRLWSAII
jgi:hypothetical protein